MCLDRVLLCGATGEENFHAVLKIIKQHESELWITGLADAYKYLTERRCARLAMDSPSRGRIALHLACSTDRKLYDQPLTIDVTFPDSWARDRLIVTDAHGNSIVARTRAASGEQTRQLRFHAPPIDTTYFIERHVAGS